MFTFSIFSVIFLAIGIVLYVMSDQITEMEVRYDERCQSFLRKEGGCEIEFGNITSTIEQPIYVYYQLDNFYQNHRRYVKSRDNEQLNGIYKDPVSLDSCDPIIKVKDLWENQKFNLMTPPVKLDDEEPAIPCGLVAKSFFNDTFQLFRKDENGKKVTVSISGSNIAWTSDVEYKFKNIQKPPKNKDWREV